MSAGAAVDGGNAELWSTYPRNVWPGSVRSGTRPRRLEADHRTGHIDRGVFVVGELLRDLGVPFGSTPRLALMSLLWHRLQVRLRRPSLARPSSV